MSMVVVRCSIQNLFEEHTAKRHTTGINLTRLAYHFQSGGTFVIAAVRQTPLTVESPDTDAAGMVTRRPVDIRLLHVISPPMLRNCQHFAAWRHLW
jgi:hypothetical protein